MATENEEVEMIEQADGTFQVADPKIDKKQAKDSEDTSDDDESDEDENEEPAAEADASDADVADDGNEESDQRPNKTEENRRKRHERKARIRERNEGLRQELAARDALIADLTSRVAQQERKTSGSEMAQLDNEIRKAAEAYNYFKSSAAALHGQPDAGKQVLDMQEKMILASRRYEDLNRVKQQYVQNQNQPPPTDPVLLRHGAQWLERNAWYDPESGDEDSEIALTVDKRMAKEGWNPRTPEYWDELDKRLQRRLPHRYKQSYNSSQVQRPKSVVTGSGRETRSESNNVSGFTLSRERVQAMKDSGAWDDPKARADIIKRYREFDRANQT